MRPRQAIVLTIAALGAGFVGASIHGVATVNADLEAMAPARHTIEQRVLDTRGDDCPFREKNRDPRNRGAADDTEI